MLRLFFPTAAILSHIVHADFISPAFRAAKIGGCYDDVDDKLLHCAATADECAYQIGFKGWMEFKSSSELSELGLDDECTTDNLRVGTCKSIGTCAITSDSCTDPADYRLPEPFGKCNAEGTFQNGIYVPTKYGGCKHRETGEIECALTPRHCLSNEHWISAYDVENELEGGCRCHDVKIGLCTTGGDLMMSDCAISKDDCDPFTQTFSPAGGHLFSSTNHNLTDCRLCPMDPPKIDANDAEMMDQKVSGALHKGEVLGFVLSISIVVILVISGLFVWFCNKTVKEYVHVNPFHNHDDLGHGKPADIPEFA